MGLSDDLERLMTLSRHQIDAICADEALIPEYIERCRQMFDEHLVEYDAHVDGDDARAQFHWQEAVAWRETAGLLTVRVSSTVPQRRSA